MPSFDRFFEFYIILIIIIELLMVTVRAFFPSLHFLRQFAQKIRNKKKPGIGNVIETNC